MTNPSSVFMHDIAVKGNGIKTKKGKIVGKNGTSTVTPSEPQARRLHLLLHRPRPRGRGGMKGKLVVTK